MIRTFQLEPSTMAGDDIELKLRLEPRDMARLRRHPLLQQLRTGTTRTTRFSSVYWDTPELTLARAGVVVRVRSSGRRRTLTVKTAGSRGAGLVARREWEWPIDGDLPDSAQLRTTGLAVLRPLETLARLEPVFSTELRRTRYLLGGDCWEVALSLDQGEVGTGDAREPVCEAELELTAGARRHLFAVAHRIAAAVPARLAVLAKSDRGYQLVAGAPPPSPLKARPIALNDQLGVGDAFQAIARNCLDQLLANERCLLETRDPEAIHQMRVALRRLRSAVRVFRSAVDGPQLAAARVEIGWLLDHLGPARDDHVFLAEIVEPVMSAHPDTVPLAALRAQWLAEHDANTASALAAVADRRFTTLLLTVAEWIEAGDWRDDPQRRARLIEPILPFARRVLSKRDKRLRAAGGDDLTALPGVELHQTRILGKQLRYAGEFFAPLFPAKATAAFLSVLSELQDQLGQINDIEVAGSRLAGDGRHGARAWAAGLVAGWHAGRRPQLLAKAAKSWDRYREARRFWGKHHS